jgi:hypothetical protein
MIIVPKKENSRMGRCDLLKKLGLGAAASTFAMPVDPADAVAEVYKKATNGLSPLKWSV